MSNNIKKFRIINPWFDKLNYKWPNFTNNSEQIELAKHETIFRQNEIGHYIYIVKTGRVRLFLISPNGEEKALTIIGENGILGECMLNNDSKYATSAITASKVSLIKIAKDDFLNKVNEDPLYFKQILDLITKKYRVLCMQSLKTSYIHSFPRVCAVFVHLSIQYGEKIDDTKIRLTINFTHQEIANLLGITRVTVAKNIKILEDKGLLQKDRHSYVISDLDKLANLANEELLLD